MLLIKKRRMLAALFLCMPLLMFYLRISPETLSRLRAKRT
jgi:hypothetical protein